MNHNFKSILVVPNAKDFIDIMLSKTQRKTPTVIHRHFKICRIRQFYMRKVKFTQQSIRDRLTKVIDDFPKLDEIHPFYADLLNILYDRDHYKIALGQLNTARHLIDNVGRDYTRLLKFADSLYRAKCLKRAALGRMCTIIKRQSATLQYLEHVRQHLSRLPSIDPNTRTLLICGFPNVGKSSFLNKITNADVDVQPYAFTTKSLYVGHTDYKYLRWQVIDTPGILDHTLEERNTIEMQAITALAHIRAAILFMIDISEECGYSIEKQIELYDNIKILFQDKPLIIVANKIDKVRPDKLSPDNQILMDKFNKQNIPILPMSTLTDEGVMDVRNSACEILLNYRLDQKMSGKRYQAIENRLRVAIPAKRDDKVRPLHIPEIAKTLSDRKPTDKPNIKLEKDLEEEQGDDYIVDLRRDWILPNSEDIYDKAVEIWDGHNVADFLNPDAEEKLKKLEEEEAALEAIGFYDDVPISDDEDTEKIRNLGKLIRNKRLLIIQESRRRRRSNKPVIPKRAVAKSKQEFIEQMEELGLEMKSEADQAHFENTGNRKSKRSLELLNKHVSSIDTIKPSRPSHITKIPRNELGLKDQAAVMKARKLMKLSQRQFAQKGRINESDRRIPTKRPKHLFSGKRKLGKTQRR
ncbi:hypothetical protein GJ496_010735 [Pomphorhynchus laevis]|nr:hypothetical protein GJ496_010735 [Pomphorhynchus laevis]